jgi:hypothetical protein
MQAVFLPFSRNLHLVPDPGKISLKRQFAARNNASRRLSAGLKRAGGGNRVIKNTELHFSLSLLFSQSIHPHLTSPAVICRK